MSILRFKTADLVKMFEATLKETEGDLSKATFSLAGDHGVYLCVNVDNQPAGDKVVYARGCNPNIDEDWYDTKGRLYGYDDGGDYLGIETLENFYKAYQFNRAVRLHIHLTPAQLRVVW